MKHKNLRRLGLPAGERTAQSGYAPRPTSAPCRVYGEGLEQGALQQMENACRLPVAVAGALMPDAHQGYGLPIGGVLATDAAVIPYAVGVDIACRMKMTVLDLPVSTLATGRHDLVRAIERETRFGVGAEFSDRRDHTVMDRDWNVTMVTRRLKDKAWAQLGTSGSGNHFVEFGVLEVFEAVGGLPPGEYLALLSHSGSRGSGAIVAQHFSRVARELRPELPKDLGHLAWLDLASDAGAEYWAAMELMGAYAAANHDLIHRHVAGALGAAVRLDVENHHNFAWRERHVLADGSSTRRDRAPQGRHAGGPRCARHHPGLDGRARLPREGKGRCGIAPVRVSRGWPADEPHAREAGVHLGGREAGPRGARRHAALGRARRGPDGLQGHRHRHGGAGEPGGHHRPLQSQAGQDGAGRRSA